MQCQLAVSSIVVAIAVAVATKTDIEGNSDPNIVAGSSSEVESDV
jgi:hypothetical protein